MVILGIETSCDETAAAIVQYKSGRFKILSNIISSQVDIHAKTGGIVPEVAAREHIKNMLPIIDQAFKKASLDYKKIDTIAVTTGPGLITSLLIGVETAKVLSYVWKKPTIPINHLEAHIYSNWLRADSAELRARSLGPKAQSPKPRAPQFPLLALVVSGGHTELVLMKKHLDYKVIGQTRDDAAGEAFDKVAKLLRLGYPGGPIISKLAEKGNPEAIDLPRPMIKEKNFDFSFAGLKTAVLYEIRSGKYNLNDKKTIANFCASFQQAVVDVLVEKTIRAAKEYKAKSVLLSGGVAANHLLRKTLKEKVKKELPNSYFLTPNSSLCTDNAAMIAAAGYFHALKHESTPWQKIKADPNWELK